MKFETIKDNKKRIGITLGIVGVIVVIGITAFTLTRASYKQTQSVPLLKGNISYNKSDLEIVGIKLQQDDGIYIDSDTIPQSGYIINKDKSSCKLNNTAVEVTYKNEGGINYIAPTKKGTKCTLYLDRGRNAAEYLVAKGEMVDELGYRYQGANPNNYVTFNNELWRIIGVFSVTNSSGYIENLVKIIRNDSIGGRVWDVENLNNWRTSDLGNELNNGDYWNNNLNSTSQKMVENIAWYIGKASKEKDIVTISSTDLYMDEIRTIDYFNIGLMCASDYTYATLSSECSRTMMLGDYDSCANNNWLYRNNGSEEWTITPDDFGAVVITWSGQIDAYDVYMESDNYLHVRPTLYLKSNVSILDNGKDGSLSKPYDLVLN